MEKFFGIKFIVSKNFLDNPNFFFNESGFNGIFATLYCTLPSNQVTTFSNATMWLTSNICGLSSSVASSSVASSLVSISWEKKINIERIYFKTVLNFVHQTSCSSNLSWMKFNFFKVSLYHYAETKIDITGLDFMEFIKCLTKSSMIHILP